ncbi:desmosome associated protein-like protein pinnin [Musca autumnalis]|uniref:desmosome associated protein-like protein pinnin n=1 Tax=Musca autumnalis TaxID=221902 RepID=UPI003CEBBD39
MTTNNPIFGLQRDLDNARDSLIIINDSIKRIVGRSKNEKDCRLDNRNDIIAFNKSILSTSLNKRTNDSKSVFNRLSSPPLKQAKKMKPSLTSRVIRELPSRQEILRAQCSDSESIARNRRMFGALLGTLNKFCQEESRQKQKEERKAQIEKKLEEQELNERESLKKERQSLFYYRKCKQIEIKCLEERICRVKDFEAWETSTINLKSYIKTKTIPSIYFKPKYLNPETENLLADCNAALSKLITKKRRDLDDDLNAMKDSHQITELDMDDCANL